MKMLGYRVHFRTLMIFQLDVFLDLGPSLVKKFSSTLISVISHSPFYNAI